MTVNKFVANLYRSSVWVYPVCSALTFRFVSYFNQVLAEFPEIIPGMFSTGTQFFEILSELSIK